MSRLEFSPRLLADSLFQGAAPGTRVTGASFDARRQIVVLEVEGPEVPDTPEVVAIFRKTPATLRVEFKDASPLRAASVVEHHPV